MNEPAAQPLNNVDHHRVEQAPQTVGAAPHAVNRSALAIETALVGFLALAIRLPGLAHEPWGDELYHILSARQYLETGVFGINGGIYNRGIVYSEMVAALSRLLGESPVVARLPALAAGVLTVMLLFAWIRRTGDRTSAWIAAAVLMFTPALIEQAQYARSYPLQHLFVLLAAVALSELIGPLRQTPLRGVALAAGAVLALAIAMSMQPLTVIAGAGLTVGMILLAGPGLARRIPRERRSWIAAAVLALLALSALVAHRSGFADQMVSLASYSDMWAERNRNEIRFYHWLLIEQFPTAWTLFPLVMILAVRRHKVVAVLSASLFVVAFVTHTLLAWKAERYFGYALPYFAALVGLAAAQVVPLVRQLLQRVAPGNGAGRVVRWTAGLTIIGFLLISNHAFVRSARLLVRDQQFLYPGGNTPTLSWDLAKPVLSPLAGTVDAVVSTEDLEAFYFLGRLDFVLDRDHLRQGTHQPEFTVDSRIMTPMIGEKSSLQRVVACHPTGLLVAMRWALGSYKMAPETADYITGNLEPIPLDPRSGLVAYRWHDKVPASKRVCNEALGRTFD